MAAWSLRPSALDLQAQSEIYHTSSVASLPGDGGKSRTSLRSLSKQKNLGKRRSSALSQNSLSRISKEYIVHASGILATPDDPFDLKHNAPIARSIEEAKARFFVERNLFSHLTATFDPRRPNHFQDEEVELEAMASRPPTFIFVGKPGSGKTTLAQKLATKLNCVYISPNSVIEHYKFRHDLPPGIQITNVNGIIKLEDILMLLAYRLMELDVFHKGYVMDGFPVIQSKEISVRDQLYYITSLPLRPHHVILLQMQDFDLFRRRCDQKYDPLTSTVYTREQYIHKMMFDPVVPPTARQEPQRRDDPLPRRGGGDDEEDEDESREGASEESFEESELGSSQDLSGIEPFDKEPGDEAPDFEPLPPHIIKRLVTRPEDWPQNVTKDMALYREFMPLLQAFVDSFDRRRVLEINAYWQPSILYKMVQEFLDNFGMSPAPVPARLIPSMENPGMFQVIPEDQYYDSDELGEEAPCIPYEEVFTGEIDWEAALRAVTVRSRVDPRFRWRISHWKNFCPVALKNGNTIVGKPELAVGFMDKVYFLHSEAALSQFEFNPRPYLLPNMPTSPIKFFVTGHPLAGKTLFSNKLSLVTGGYVIDMKRQFRKRYPQIKADYLFRIRLQGVLEITKQVDRENFVEWKRLERNRREEVLKWIERFIRMRANAEINAMLDMEKDDRRKLRMQLRAASEFHQLGDIYTGSCTTDAGTGVGFTWHDFKKAMREGRRKFTHQQNLELAWQLFHEGKLRYKVNRRALARLLRRQGPRDMAEEEEDMELDGEGADVDVDDDADDEWFGEGSEPDSSPATPHVRRRKRRRKRKICAPAAKPVPPVTTDEEAEDEVESVDSSVFGSDEETDESIRLRFPEIPAELIEGIPRPSSVTEFHPQVVESLEKRHADAEAWTNTNPPELYIEVLKLAVAEAEEKFLSKNPHGPLSGGWIVENLPLDIEKWRLILRTQETKPDHVVVLCDTEPGHPKLLHNLKQVHADAKPRRYGEYVGEGGEGEMVGEDGELPLRLHKSQLDMSMTEFIVNCLPVDQLGLGSASDITEMDPAALAQHLRNVSVTDSILDADQKKILTDWLESFDNPDTGNPDEEVDPRIPPPPVPVKAQVAVKVLRETPDLEFEWTPRKINYEMLSSYQYGGSSTEGSAPPTADMSVPSTAATEPQIIKSATQLFLDEYEGEMTTSLLDLMRGAKGETPTPASLLSKADLFCPPEQGPEEPPCVPFIHEPSLKRVFERQIQQFDDWYNMLHSLIQKEGVLSWQLGLVDLDTAYDKALSLYEDLERRFDFVATRITPNQLKEETEEWKDANKMWSLGVEGIRTGSQEDSEMGEEEEVEDWEAAEWAGEADDELPEFLKYRDPFERLIGRPEEYRQAVAEIEKLQYYGDLKYYCPVTLFHFNVLRRGKYAAKWLDRTYLMADPEFRDLFVDSPTKFLPTNAPLPVPPARICVTGSPGCGQEEVALKVAMENKVYYVNFRQRLHEIIKVKLGHDVGPGKASTLMRRGFLSEATSRDMLGSMEDIAEEEGEYEGDYRRGEVEQLALRNFGILKPVNVATCPLTNLDRTETLAERDWSYMNTLEVDIKAFLEHGDQLPPAVLDEFVAPLWRDEPFKSKGFVLVGFPNTAADLDYLMRRKYFPEFVHILDSKPRTMRNRLVLKTVQDWKDLHPVKKKRKVSVRGTAKPRPRILSERDKSIIMNEYMPLPVSDDEEAANKFKIQKNAITERVTRSLLHFHRIYSNGIRGLMMAMNRERVDWNVIHTDRSLSESKRILTERLNGDLKYRSSLLEATFDLSGKEAAMLIERAYFRLSKFGRFCPVEAYKGNTTINLWHAPNVVKYPILHRNYIYFIAGAENARFFRQNVWDIIKRDPPTPIMPLVVLVNGPAQSGKTELAKRLENELGLVYISQESVINDTVRHSFMNSDGGDFDIFDMTASNLTSGPMAMTMADEVLAYLRGGYLIPQFMFYRALDLSLMAPRAQFHGVVFDNYPLEEAQLQELLERGVVPSVVVNLEMDPSEGYRRSNTKRFNPNYNYEDMTPDCEGFLDYLNEDYQPNIDPCLEWYKREIQCLFNVDAKLSPRMIFQQVKAKCLDIMGHMQTYIAAVLTGRPATLTGTSPLTSILNERLCTKFGNYDPVALNDRNELVRVCDFSDLSRVVEFKTELYVFHNDKHVEMFLRDPEKYTYPGCQRLPPVEVPVQCILTDEEMALLEDHWGFMTFDPVFYVEGNMQFKWLKHCDGRFCVEFRDKLYFFLSANNMEKFLRQPQKYINIPVPARVPAKGSRPLDSLTPSGYVIASGLTQQLSQILAMVGAKRPRFPYMSSTRSGLLYMGYYLKTLNNEANPALRKHYRRAMAHMTRTQHAAEQLMRQVDRNHGVRHVPPLLKQRLDAYMVLATKPDNEKVVDPYIPGLGFNFEKVKDPEQAMFDDILADLLKQRAAGCCRGGGDADQGSEDGSTAGREVEGETESNEGDEEEPEVPLIDMENYVVPAYLAKDRLQ